MPNVDVAIVGAGPAGSAAAITLARNGYSVALLDKAKFPREKLCGDFLNPINWPLLRELGVNADVLSRPHEKIATFRLTTSSGEETEFPIPRGNDGTSFGLGLRRYDLDYVLLQKAEREGAQVLQGCRATNLLLKSKNWCLGFEHSAVYEELSAKVLIAADGRNSWVAHRLGLANSAKHGRSVGFQLHLKRSGGLDGKIEIHLFPGGYAGVVAIGGDTVNLCFSIEKDRLGNGRSDALLVEKFLSENPTLRKILCSDRVSQMRSTYPLYFPPRRPCADGVLLVGDAARVSEPVSGEGIYFAMKSGLLAAETVHRAFRQNDFSSGQLRGYVRASRAAFQFRSGLNSLIGFLIYRPALVSRLVRLSGKRGFLSSIVRAICNP
jgi:geranylgeranyl reductase family protein